MNLDKASHACAAAVLAVIRRVKPRARNAVYRALHHAESALASCVGMVRFPKRRKKTRKASKKTKGPKNEGT